MRRATPHPQVATNLDKLSDLLTPASRILIVGGGEDAHGLWRITQRTDLSTITFDIYRSDLVDFVADAHAIPLQDGSVDCVVVQAVLEHVLDPWKVASELHRVLRADGYVYAETPFLQQVHEGAYDFTRFTESGHRWLFRKFAMLDSGSIGGPVLVLSWTVDSLLRGLGTPSKVRAVFRRILTRMRNLDNILNKRLGSDSASAVFFLGQKKEAYEMSRSEIVEFYGHGSTPC